MLKLIDDYNRTQIWQIINFSLYCEFNLFTFGNESIFEEELNAVKTHINE